MFALTKAAPPKPKAKVMTRNTGKPSENIFDSYVLMQGKRFCLIPFQDQASLVGLNRGKIVKSANQPSDRLVVWNGHTVFCEIKSTEDPTGFRLALIKDTQVGFAKKITAAAGQYDIFIHSLSLNQWFRVSWPEMAKFFEGPKRSVRWEELKSYRFEPLERLS